MAKAAHTLPPIQSYADGLPIYFLTGKKYIHQTLFCIQSLKKVCSEHLRFIVVDDGSFDDELLKRLTTQLPDARLTTHAEIEDNLKKALPETKYPVLHAKRRIYPHLKKLTDIHTIAGDDWKLVLDSDMLFWNQPTQLLNWLRKPDRPIHMIDCIESYGYSRNIMQRLAGQSIPDKINVGAIGLKSSEINWMQLNDWIAALEEKEGATYYLEQALTAMIIGDSITHKLNSAEYIVNPSSLNPNHDILHHYVDVSKKIYLKDFWTRFVCV